MSRLELMQLKILVSKTLTAAMTDKLVDNKNWSF